jgi:hypothetical protein
MNPTPLAWSLGLNLCLLALVSYVVWRSPVPLVGSLPWLDAERSFAVRTGSLTEACVNTSVSAPNALTPVPGPQYEALIIMSHAWDDSIASGVQPFLASAAARGLRTAVVLTNWTSVAVPAPPSALFLLPQDLPGAGTQAIWAHSHWISLWYWRNVGRPMRVSAVWFVEYDVRASGNLSALWDFRRDVDLVTTKPSLVIPKTKNQKWILKLYKGRLSKLKPNARLKAQKQVFRASARLLDYLDGELRAGNDAQDEAFLATHARKGLFSTADLSSFCDAGFTFSKDAARSQYRSWREHVRADPLGNGTLRLFHPIKSGLTRRLRG